MHTLPTLAELHHDVQAAFKNDQLNLLLNQPPHASWLKKFPAEMGIVGGGEYMPIDKVEFMLTRIFQEWYCEILREGVLFQSVYMVVRLHYKNPLTGEWAFKDGCGAVPVQTNKGKSAADLAEIKLRAVQMALPIAKSAAKKDAAEELGALFGRDLNRKDTVLFAGAFTDAADAQPSAPPVQHTQAMIHAENEKYVPPAYLTRKPEPVAASTGAFIPPPQQPIQPAFQNFNTAAL